MSQVTLYRATDGKLFDTEADQVAYDAHLANKEAIETFLNKHFPIPEPEIGDDGKKKHKQAPGRGPARKAIALWIAENQ